METKKITVPEIKKMKKKGEKIACLTAYDWCFASFLDSAGIDLILVGDSASMVFSGYETTLPMTMDQMIYHSQAVKRGVSHALVISDMPFLSYQKSPEQAIENAGRFLKECGVDGVKLEGGKHIVETIKKLTGCGIPVMGHLGLTPQSIHQFGGYTIQGKDGKSSKKLINDAMALEEAGVFSIVLEKIPSKLAQKITLSISIPTIGIGAGKFCDGQILVSHDIFGLFESFKPKFARRYAEIGSLIVDSSKDYIKDVKNSTFPSDKESY